jgi:hypothetical protein
MCKQMYIGRGRIGTGVAGNNEKLAAKGGEKMLRKGYKYVALTVAVLATSMIMPFSAFAAARTCRLCTNSVATGSNYCTDHLCEYSGCKRPIYQDGYTTCLYHTCREKGCNNVVTDESGAKACSEHYEKYKDLAGTGGKVFREILNTSSSKKRSASAKTTGSSTSKKSSSSAKSSSSSSTKTSSTAKKCKYSGCKNWGVTYKKGYCNKHYDQLYGKRDDYYDEDPESYYQDNKSQYRSRSEAYDDWEDEYEED